MVRFILRYIKASLTLQLSLLVLLVTTIILTIFGWYRYSNTATEMEARLNEDLKIAFRTLSKSIAKPIYNYDIPTAEDICLAVLNRKNFIYVGVDNVNKVPLIAFKKNEQSQIQKTDKHILTMRGLSRSEKLFFKEEHLGYVNVVTTRAFLEKSLFEVLQATVFQILFIDLALVAALVLLLQFRFVGPVKKLTEISSDIARGNLDQATVEYGENELGVLCRAIFIMRDSVKEKIEMLRKEVLERINVEEALRHSQERLDLAMFGANDGIWDWHLDKNTLDYDARYYTMAGYEPNEFPGVFEEWEQRVHPEDIGQAKLAIEQYLAGDLESFEIEFRFLRKDKRYMWIRGRGKIVKRNEIGTPVRFIGTHSDITARKRAEAALRESEERFRAIFAQAAVGIAHVASDGRWIRVNDKLCEIVGYSREELLQIRFQDITYPDDLDGDLDYVRRMWAAEIDTYSIEKRYIRKDASIVWANLTVSMAKQKDGRPKYFISVLEDISNRKNAENELMTYQNHLEDLVGERTIELEQAKEQADASNQAKTSFLARMTHELRTPLNTVIGFSDILLRDAATGLETLSSAQKENLSIVHRSGEHLLTLVDDVLELSRIESGRVSVNITSCDLDELRLSLEDMFTHDAAQKGLRLEFELAADLPRFVKTDKVKLRQVLINLLSNAVKFTEKGVVRVRAGASSPGDDSDSVRLRFEVSDTGEGIAPDEQAVLFNVFAQTQSGRETQKGTGLGLSISQKFVKLMGGDITVNSQPGKGSVFAFEIPAKRTEAPPLRDRKPTSRMISGLQSGQTRYRILVVDDMPNSRALVVRLLRPLGFDVREAENGQTGIEQWERFNPHLIWMDIRMPVMDGYEATRRIKAAPGGGQTKILALTANSFEEERAKILESGCDDCLSKPFKANDLLEMMAEHLEINWAYEDSKEENIEASEAFTPALETLPRELVESLYNEAVRANLKAVNGLIDEIHQHNPDIAKGLKEVAGNLILPG